MTEGQHPSQTVERQQKEGCLAVNTSSTTSFTNVYDSSLRFLSSINPAFIMFASSVPCIIRSYQLYQRPLDDLLETVVRVRSDGKVSASQVTKEADVTLRRAVAYSVTSRALGIATFGSLGAFGLFAAVAFYATGCQTGDEAISSIREWSKNHRREIDNLLGVENRVDEDHPEMQNVQAMTESEEMDYVTKLYYKEEGNTIKKDPGNLRR